MINNNQEKMKYESVVDKDVQSLTKKVAEKTNEIGCDKIRKTNFTYNVNSEEYVCFIEYVETPEIIQEG